MRRRVRRGACRCPRRLPARCEPGCSDGSEATLRCSPQPSDGVQPSGALRPRRGPDQLSSGASVFAVRGSPGAGSALYRYPLRSSATSTTGCIGSIRSPTSFQVGRQRRWKGCDPCGGAGAAPRSSRQATCAPPASNDSILGAEDLFVYEDRVGIGVDAKTGTAGEGMIYSVRMMRLRPDVTLAIDLVGAREDLEACCPNSEDVLALGGESRRAIVRRIAAGTWPAPVNAQGGGKLILLTTPAPFGGWRPPGLPLVAAAVPGYVPVSGWDLARRGPKPNRFAVAAGSVYFVISRSAVRVRSPAPIESTTYSGFAG